MRPDHWPLRDVLRPVDPLPGRMGRHYGAFMWAVKNLPPEIGADASRWRAVRAAFEARRRVPAYRQFLADAGVRDADVEALRLPETDKDNYIRRFSIDERCVGGSLPTNRVAIDESSGSTGTPYNWVRSLEERSTSHTFVSHFARYCFGTKPFITINAFSMGAWATGVNMGIALQRNGVVKNTGPDIDKILHTLDFVGPRRQYLICGYPPFLTLLIDSAAERSFPLEKLQVLLRALIAKRWKCAARKDVARSEQIRHQIPRRSSAVSDLPATTAAPRRRWRRRRGRWTPRV